MLRAALDLIPVFIIMCAFLGCGLSLSSETETLSSESLSHYAQCSAVLTSALVDFFLHVVTISAVAADVRMFYLSASEICLALAREHARKF